MGGKEREKGGERGGGGRIRGEVGGGRRGEEGESERREKKDGQRDDVGSRVLYKSTPIV